MTSIANMPSGWCTGTLLMQSRSGAPQNKEAPPVRGFQPNGCNFQAKGVDLQIVGTNLAGTVPVAAAVTPAPNVAAAVAFVADTQAQSTLPVFVPIAAVVSGVGVPPTLTRGNECDGRTISQFGEIPPAVVPPL